MSKIKEVHQYDGTQWGQAVPIGADASNVDVKTSDDTDVSLQSVLGSFSATEPSIKTQINRKVDKEGGDIAHTIINDPVNEIPIYDLDTEETSEKLISDDISIDTDMVVMSGNGENLTTMWGKFNRFRKRVDNKFKNYLVTSLEGVAPGASSDTKGYSTQALNNYFSDVIGYTSAASVLQVGSVASQLSLLNSNMVSKPTTWNNIANTGIFMRSFNNLVTIRSLENFTRSITEVNTFVYLFTIPTDYLSKEQDIPMYFNVGGSWNNSIVTLRLTPSTGEMHGLVTQANTSIAPFEIHYYIDRSKYALLDKTVNGYETTNINLPDGSIWKFEITSSRREGTFSQLEQGRDKYRVYNLYTHIIPGRYAKPVHWTRQSDGITYKVTFSAGSEIMLNSRTYINFSSY